MARRSPMLIDIPTEILIIDYVDLPSNVLLKTTDRYFNTFITALSHGELMEGKSHIPLPLLLLQRIYGNSFKIKVLRVCCLLPIRKAPALRERA